MSADRDLVEHWCATETVGGAQVVVVRHGVRTADVTVGTRSADGAPVTARTRFPLWSATKPVTAAALHLLVDAGYVHYDDRVATYWPEFAANGKGAVTVRQVLTHTAGLPDLEGVLGPGEHRDWHRATALLAGLPLEPAAGSVVYHALTASAVIAVVVERVTGRRFADVVHDRVLLPAGMQDTSWAAPLDCPDDTTDVVTTSPALQSVAGEILDAIGSGAVVPGGGLWSTARDLAGFYGALPRLLSPRLLAEVTMLHAPFGPHAQVGFGLHMMVGVDPRIPGSRGSRLSSRTYGHPGWCATLALCDPERALVLVALVNTALPQEDSDARFARLCDALADVES